MLVTASLVWQVTKNKGVHMAYLLLVYVGTSPQTGLNSLCLGTLIDYKGWLQRKKRQI